MIAKGPIGLLLHLSVGNAMKPMFMLTLLALSGILLALSGCAPQNDWARQPGAGDPEIQAILRDFDQRVLFVADKVNKIIIADNIGNDVWGVRRGAEGIEKEIIHLSWCGAVYSRTPDKLLNRTT